MSSLREDRHRTADNGVSWMYMRRRGRVCGGWEWEEVEGGEEHLHLSRHTTRETGSACC